MTEIERLLSDMVGREVTVKIVDDGAGGKRVRVLRMAPPDAERIRNARNVTPKRLPDGR
jgi:hypothetical protein